MLDNDTKSELIYSLFYLPLLTQIEELLALGVPEEMVSRLCNQALVKAEANFAHSLARANEGH